MVSLALSKEDCKNIAEFLEIYFFQNIRDDEDMDNLEYVRSLLHCIDELKRVSKGG
jgi:hypothetical protein